MVTGLNYHSGCLQFFVVVVLLSGNLYLLGYDDVTGAFQGPLRVGRTPWRDHCVLLSDWITAECSSLPFHKLFLMCQSLAK